jgi:short-subunit dehydrogenase
VAICARDAAELEEAAEHLRRDGIEATTVVCDVADRPAVERMLMRVRDALGGVDILVNHAGEIGVAPIEAVRVEDFERAMGIMFWGTLYPTLSLLPEMRARRSGRIVNIASNGGRIGEPHLLPYTAAKFAAVGFSEGLHAELAAHGVSVLTVTPGLMRTGSHLAARFGGRQEAEYGWFALGATMPGISMDAERAARAIVDATARGASDLVLTLPARVATAVHGIFPGTTARALGLVDRLLPSGGDGGRRIAPGWVVAARIGSPMLHVLTTLGRRAAQRFQHGVPVRGT